MAHGGSLVMLFEEVFLENADIQKLRMFRVLKSMDESGFTITDLGNHLHISYQQSYNVFQELLNDIETITGRSGPTVKKNVLAGDFLPVTIDQYRLFLLQESIQFQYLDYIIQSRSANTDRFCQDHFISRSTLARKTTPLRTMLELHGIKLSFSRPGFSGSEQNIRQFLYIFYWLCFRGVEWPFTTVPQNRIAERYAQLPQVGMNTIDRLRNLLMLAVADLRIAHGHTLGPMPTWEHLWNHSELVTAPINQQWYPRLSRSELARENQFLAFQRAIEFNFTHDHHAWAPLYDTIMGNDNVIHRYVDALVDCLENHRRNGATLTVKDDPVLVTNFIRVALANIVGGPNFPTIMGMNDPESELYTHSNIYKTLVAAQPTIMLQLGLDQQYSVTACQQICEELCYLLAPHLTDFEWEQMVNCRILVTNNDFNSRRLATFIGNMSFVHIMPETESDQPADLIITGVDDAKLFQAEASDPQRVFVWATDVSGSDFYRLFITVEELMFNKLGIPFTSHQIV